MSHYCEQLKAHEETIKILEDKPADPPQDPDVPQYQVETPEKEAQEYDSIIHWLVNSVNELKATVNSMTDQLYHCSEGKGKELIKIEESIGLE